MKIDVRVSHFKLKKDQFYVFDYKIMSENLVPDI